jgi:hypothetical protein
MELAARDLGVANTWDFFTRFARDIYGPRAARIDVTGKWMEQDPAAWPIQDKRAMARVAMVVVVDAAKTRLGPDLTTLWWQEWLHQPVVLAMTEEARAAAMTEARECYAAAWPFIPTEQEAYWVDTPPAHHGRILYVRGSEWPV